jgi:hypothetical protein
MSNGPGVSSRSATQNASRQLHDAGPRYLETDPARSSVSSPPLTPMEPLQLRNRLQETWREQVEILSTTAVRAHMAMHRLDTRRYGLCEVCCPGDRDRRASGEASSPSLPELPCSGR